MANEPEKQTDDERQEDQPPQMANEHQQPANEPATHEQVLDAHYDLVELGQFFYENGFFLMKKMNLSLHHLCTWWDVLEVCRERPYLSDSALAEVRKFLEDPVTWSRAHGGIGSVEEAKPKDAME